MHSSHSRYMIGEAWLNEKRIKILEENGIPKRIYHNRINRGWEIKKALNTPYKVRKKSEYGDLLEVAYENGVDRIFHQRVRAGYDPDDAAFFDKYEIMKGNKNANK